MFYAKKYDSANDLATLWSALVSQYSLSIVQFVVRMRSNKNHKMRHCRKKNCGLEGFPLTLGYLKCSLIDTAFTFQLNSCKIS